MAAVIGASYTQVVDDAGKTFGRESVALTYARLFSACWRSWFAPDVLAQVAPDADSVSDALTKGVRGAMRQRRSRARCLHFVQPSF